MNGTGANNYKQAGAGIGALNDSNGLSAGSKDRLFGVGRSTGLG